MSLRLLVVTINVGCIGDDARLRAALEPAAAASHVTVVAIHVQELGGSDKHLDQATRLEQVLLQLLPASDWVTTGLLFNSGAPSCRVVPLLLLLLLTRLLRVDPDTDFSALGSMFYVRRDLLEGARFFHWRVGDFVPLAHLLDLNPNVRFAAAARSRKFTRAEYHEFGRKGFLLVRLAVMGRTLAFLNVHLPADMDNVQVCAS